MPLTGPALPTPESTRHRRVRVLVALAFGWLALTARAEAPIATTTPVQLAAVTQPAVAQESRVKAAYLVKFTQYTTWPATAFESDTAPIIIGVIGPSLMIADLEREARPITNPRRIEIRVVANPEEAAHCHAIFFSRTDSSREESWLLVLQKKPVLTVAETDLAIKHGSILHLGTEGKKIFFEVSRPAMERASLKLSTDMLRHAKTVHNGSEATN